MHCSLTLFLTGCSNTMANISYMEDLDNTDNTKALANKLPYRLKEAWRKSACDLQEKTKKQVKFKDFDDFVNKQVKYILHPLYGHIKDPTAGSKDPVRQKPNPQYTETLKPRKVFTTAVVSPETQIKMENTKCTNCLSELLWQAFSLLQKRATQSHSHQKIKGQATQGEDSPF